MNGFLNQVTVVAIHCFCPQFLWRLCMHGNQIIAGYFINERQILLHIYTPVRRFPVGNDRFVGRGKLGGGGCRQERQGVSVGGWNGPLRSLTSVQHHINNVHWQGYGLPVLRFSFRQCDFSPSFSSSIHGMLINASVACLTATAELFWEGEGERLGDYLRKVSLESCWEINHCSGKTIAIKCNMSERKSSIL